MNKHSYANNINNVQFQKISIAPPRKGLEIPGGVGSKVHEFLEGKGGCLNKFKDQNLVSCTEKITNFWFPQGMIIFLRGVQQKWTFQRGWGVHFVSRFWKIQRGGGS